METTAVYKRIRQRARQIAALFPTPDFYLTCEPACRRSVQFYENDRVICRLKSVVVARIENDFGHGMDHAAKVSIDAGALVLVETDAAAKVSAADRQHLRLTQSAGLLHDICRKRKNHAVEGARMARKILYDFPFSADEAEAICHAIRNHEAFQPTVGPATAECGLIAGCLYDADKFRWGPDNFTDTIWDMIAFSGMPPAEFVQRFPKGMAGLVRIRDTFRTRTGKQFGPQFIDIGIDIGHRLLQVIETEFAEYL